MTHLWVRAEQRPNEDRVGLTPDGAKTLIAAGLRVTVEDSRVRAIGIDGYRAAGCEIAPENSWPDAPKDAIIFGLSCLKMARPSPIATSCSAMLSKDSILAAHYWNGSRPGAARSMIWNTWWARTDDAWQLLAIGPGSRAQR